MGDPIENETVVENAKSEDNVEENGMETDQDLAEAKKNEGNTFYKKKEYHQAIKLYSEAIKIFPTCASFYTNRAAAYMMLDKYAEALQDAQHSVKLDDQLVKGHLREAKCQLALGSVEAAIRALQRVTEIEPTNKQAQSEMRAAKIVQIHDAAGDKAFNAGDYRKVVFDMERAIDHSPACVRFKVRRAEALLKLRRFSEAQEAVNAVLVKDPRDPDALYVRGLSLYYQDNIDKAQQHFQHVLRLSPDYTKAKLAFKKCKQMKAKKDEGNSLFKEGKLREAYDAYTEALSIDPHNVYTNAKLYCNRAVVCSKLNKLEEAVEDCNKAIELDQNYLKAYLRRAKCYMDSEKYDEAVRDYDKIFQMDRTKENKRLLQEAKLEQKKSKRKDYYKTLGLQKSATDDEIKKAYRKHALLHHPDRHSSKTAEEQKQEELKFKEVSEAYSVLSDGKKKRMYDNGQDLDDMDGFSGAGFDPNQIFQTFFGGGGGPFTFNMGGGGGGFPGGYHFQF
ncbi:dnaJ homolog subfamily C member 7-like [Diadema setosum]|uniref:dnaJ homolog subfamily C member 7-like n=1 Tax=Diadema setosum TaxID=31175 RepID=UPI003B3BD8DA